MNFREFVRNRIVVFDAGSERTIEPGSEEFQDIWLAVHQIANGGKSEGLDCVLTNWRVEEYKKMGQGIEFWYDYTYTGHIASVKVDNLRGDQSYYVVALEVTQTPTQVVNGN